MSAVHKNPTIASCGWLQIRYPRRKTSEQRSTGLHYPRFGVGLSSSDAEQAFTYPNLQSLSGEVDGARERAHSVVPSSSASVEQDFRERGQSEASAISRSNAYFKSGVLPFKARKYKGRTQKLSLEKLSTIPFSSLEGHTESLEKFDSAQLMDASRLLLSPRIPGGAGRTADTEISMHDAEAYMLPEFRAIAMDRIKALSRDEPAQIIFEFHGSEGPCGQSENDELAEGCKGRLYTASKALAKAFLDVAAPGSSVQALSIYFREVYDKNRHIPNVNRDLPNVTVPTYYGYKENVVQAAYGPKTGRYKIYKRTIGEWDHDSLSKSDTGRSAAAATLAPDAQ